MEYIDEQGFTGNPKSSRLIPVIQADSLEAFQNAIPAAPIIPDGAKVDIEIGQAWWSFVMNGNLYIDTTFKQPLEEAGLMIESQESSNNFLTNVTLHCRATRDVAVNNLSLNDLSGSGTQEAGGGKVIAVAIMSGLAILGLAAAITYINISADQLEEHAANVDLAKDMLDQGYTPEQVQTTIDAANNVPSQTPQNTLGLPSNNTIMIIALAVAAIVILPAVMPAKKQTVEVKAK